MNQPPWLRPALIRIVVYIMVGNATLTLVMSPFTAENYSWIKQLVIPMLIISSAWRWTKGDQWDRWLLFFWSLFHAFPYVLVLAMLYSLPTDGLAQKGHNLLAFFQNFSVFILALFLVCAVIVVALRIDPNEDEGGFISWVRNPDWRRWSERNPRPTNQPPRPEEYPKLVKGLFKASDTESWNRLRAGLPETLPILLDALDRPGIDRTFGSKGLHIFEPKSPGCRILKALEAVHDPRLEQRLIQLLDQTTDHDLRKTSLMLLASQGTSTVVPAVLTGLSDEDEYIRSHTIIGIGRALGSGANIEFKNRLFEPTIDLLRGSDPKRHTKDVVLLAHRLDPVRTAQQLLLPEFWSIADRRLCSTAQGMMEFDVLVPVDLLRSALTALAASDNLYFKKYGGDACLRLLAMHPQGLLDPVVLPWRGDQDPEIAESLLRAEIRATGLVDPTSTVFELVRERGIDLVDQKIRMVHDLLVLDGEVCNGGISQYLVNSSGDRWPQARSALMELGCMDTVRQLDAVTVLFGVGGPPTDRDQRHQALAKVHRAHESKLGAFDTSYYQTKEVFVAILRLIRDHPESFKAPVA